MRYMKIINLSNHDKIYTSNVYLITGDWNKLSDINTLIDVGRDPSIFEKIDNTSTGVGKKRIEQIVLTHSHYDHATLLPVMKKRYNPKSFAASPLLPGIDVILKGGEKLKIADREFEVIYTPGHSNDSICLYCEKEKVLFAGDTPLIIRTQNGTYEDQYIQAFEYIAKKDIETIYFGHGEPLKINCRKILLDSLNNAKSLN